MGVLPRVEKQASLEEYDEQPGRPPARGTHTLRRSMRGQTRRSPVLVQRAASEDPRWTRAVGDYLARPLSRRWGARTIGMCSFDARRLNHYECHSQRGNVNKLGGDGGERLGALLARGTRALRRASFDARNRGSTRLPCKEVEGEPG